MNYRSISDMNDAILRNLYRVPADVDLIVGVPRSGMIAAELLALQTNVELTDLDSYLAGKVFTSGSTKKLGMKQGRKTRRKVVVIDDSINGGTAMKEARRRVSESGLQDDILFGAVFGSKPHHPEADLVMETVPWPRMFQWNFMHHKFLQQSCIDIDGVLCHDPSADENDDGPNYVKFLEQARPLYRFTRPLGTLVTSRLEKYRGSTEGWLAAQNIEYAALQMLDLPSKAERQRLGAHGSFKGEFYRDSDAILFIESENRQAREIARISGKPVLCLETHTLVQPERALIKSGYTAANNRLRGLVKMAATSIFGKARLASIRHRLSR